MSDSLNNNIKYLLGPTSIVKMTKLGSSKIIYLFGDFHEKFSKCPIGIPEINKLTFDDLLISELKSNPDSIVDLFIEATYINKLYPKSKYNYTSSYMIDIIDKFKNCLELDKDTCAFKNVRMHYVDVRSFGSMDVRVLQLLYIIVTSLLKGESEIAYISWENLTKELMENKTNPTEIIKNMKDMSNIYSSTKITKQIENIINHYNDVGEDLQNILNYNNEFYIANKFKLLDLIDKLNLGNLQKEIDNNYLNDMWKILNQLTVRLMDVYLLARMFRTFNTKDTINVPSKYSSPPENIIIYAGQYHIDFYIYFLKNHGFQLDVESYSKVKETNYQCVSLEKIPLPLFPKRVKSIKRKKLIK
jgi:hypothetical protein